MEKAYYSIKDKHLKKNSEDKVEFNFIDVPHYEGHARLLYFPLFVTFKMFSDQIRTMREEHKR